MSPGTDEVVTLTLSAREFSIWNVPMGAWTVHIATCVGCGVDKSTLACPTLP